MPVDPQDSPGGCAAGTAALGSPRHEFAPLTEAQEAAEGAAAWIGDTPMVGGALGVRALLGRFHAPPHWLQLWKRGGGPRRGWWWDPPAALFSRSPSSTGALMLLEANQS